MSDTTPGSSPSGAGDAFAPGETAADQPAGAVPPARTEQARGRPAPGEPASRNEAADTRDARRTRAAAATVDLTTTGSADSPDPVDPAVRRLPWWLKPRDVFRHLLALEDSDHAKALGVAIGMCVGMTPTVGLQIMMVLTLALLTRRLFYFNVPAAIVTVYVSNPLTIVPIYWFNYQVGTLFIATPGAAPSFASVLEYDGFAAWWDTLTTLLIRIGPPLIVGSAIVSIVAGLLTYPLMRWLLRRLKRNTPAPSETVPDGISTQRNQHKSTTASD